MRLISVNVGKPRPNPGQPAVLTGIDKQPVSGPVMVTAPGREETGAVGLAGDRVYDVPDHGGPDQAIYAYAGEDLDFWAAELGTPLRSGVFGENLTTADVDVTAALIGERWRVGPDVVLEVSCPRIPCHTFQGWLAQAGWIKRFTQAGRPGTYLRVIEPGQIGAGDPVVVESRPGPRAGSHPPRVIPHHPGSARGVGMPILKRRTRSDTTAQPADRGAVPTQRETQESTRSPETGTGPPAAQAGQQQTAERRAEAQPYGEAGESRPEARRRHYGMAATLMILSGMLTFFVGITGVIRGIFFNTVTNYPFYFSVRSRGITFVVIGAVAFAVGLALLFRMHWARHVATVVAVVSAVANFMFLPFYPLWSIAVLTLDIIIIWELTRDREGREFTRLPCPARVPGHDVTGGVTFRNGWDPAENSLKPCWKVSTGLVCCQLSQSTPPGDRCAAKYAATPAVCPGNDPCAADRRRGVLLPRRGP